MVHIAGQGQFRGKKDWLFHSNEEAVLPGELQEQDWFFLGSKVALTIAE
jgi:hypothetical protein